MSDNPFSIGKKNKDDYLLVRLANELNKDEKLTDRFSTLCTYSIASSLCAYLPMLQFNEKHKTAASIFFVGEAKSGSGKTTIIDQLLDPIHSGQIANNKKIDLLIDSAGKDKGKVEKYKKRKSYIIAKGITPATLPSKLCKNSYNLSISCTEPYQAATILDYGPLKNNDRDTIKQCWSGEFFSKDTVGQEGITYSGFGTLSLTLVIQYGFIKEIVSEVFAIEGFTSRSLYCEGDTKKKEGKPDELPFKQYKKACSVIFDWVHERKDDIGFKYFREYENRNALYKICDKGHKLLAEVQSEVDEILDSDKARKFSHCHYTTIERTIVQIQKIALVTWIFESAHKNSKVPELGSCIPKKYIEFAISFIDNQLKYQLGLMSHYNELYTTDSSHQKVLDYIISRTKQGKVVSKSSYSSNGNGDYAERCVLFKRCIDENKHLLQKRHASTVNRKGKVIKKRGYIHSAYIDEFVANRGLNG